jgi:hypothetical protein
MGERFVGVNGFSAESGPANRYPSRIKSGTGFRSKTL